MRSKFISDPQDSFDSALDAADVTPVFLPPAGNGLPSAVAGLANPPTSAPPLVAPALEPTVPAETVEAQAALSSSTGTGSVVAETSGTGMTIDLEFDAAAMASTTAAASFRAGIEQAASILSATITDKVTVNIAIDYSGTGGGAAAGPVDGTYVNYSTVRADLVNSASKGDPTFDALPTGSTIQGQSLVAVWDAQLKVMGLPLPSGYDGVDGDATFATDIQPNLLVGVALHELTHALGRVPYGTQPDIFDFYRFTSTGTQLFSGNIPAPAAYFSVDGGHTKIADYGQTSDPSDFLNSGVQGGNDPFNEFYTPSTTQGLTVYDLEQLDVLGFHLSTSLTTTIQTDTNSVASTSLVQFFGNYYVENAGSGAGPELKFGGTPVVAGEFGAWVAIGAVQTASGYEVAWSLPGGNQYSIWSTDSSGNFISQVDGLTGTSPALEAAESVFGQDLNGDGVIGPGTITKTVIQTDGSTSLTEVAQNYFLYNNGGTGPELQYGGADVTAGEFGAWVPIGAVKTTGGYEVAWSLPGANQYSIWTTDSTGKFISQIAGLTGTSPALEAAESIFGQDLNGDGVIGLTKTVIQTDGSTSLTEVAQNYFLYNNGGTGPELQYGGADVTAGEFGAWVPIGAVQTTGGYEVAWSLPGANQYSIWTTDSTGKFISQLDGLTGTSPALEAAESVFNQDLNGDGVIGLTKTVIQTDGSTSLTEVAQNYFLYNNGGTGPELQYGGADVTAGEFGAWVPIGAVQTTGGYEVAWSLPGANQYSIWTTDSTGKFISQVAGLTGTSSALEAAESVFGQDLNGDGVIGQTKTVIQIDGSISLTEVSQNYFVYNGGRGQEGSAAIGTGATLELAAADSGSVKFDGPTGTLILDQPSTFSGQIFNLSGDGSLSNSDQIDLKDVAFGPGTTVAYTGSSTGGTLSVSDAQNHTASISLAGNYTNSTFSLSSDGSGGTVVIDPPVKQDLASGTLSFNDADSTDTHTATVTSQNGGQGYVGSFIVDAVTAANGQDSVGWHFNQVTTTVAQSYEVTVTDNHVDNTNSTITQPVTVTVAGPGNDAFVFHPGVGAEVIVNGASSDTIELDGFSPVTSSKRLASLLAEAQPGQPQSLFHSTNDGHDTTIHLGNHDSITLANVQLANLHASNFIIG